MPLPPNESHPQKKPIRVAIIEDHAMFRDSLGQIITRGLPGVVCGEANNIADGLDVIERTKPDIVLVDISLQGSSGLELVKNLKAREIDVPVLVLSMHNEALYAERALRAGARGYITKLEPTTTLLQAMQQVLAGSIYLGEKMTAVMLERVSGRSAASATGVALLADRELEVFQLLGKGYNSPKIAAQLKLSVPTIESYRARIKEKLGLKSAAEVYSAAAQWLEQQGM